MRWTGVLVLWLVSNGWLAAATVSAPPRIAIVTGIDVADLSALVVTELSQNEGVHLVERDELAKVGDELKLRQLAGTDSVSLGKLVGADGLLFLNRGPEGIEARFTAVGLGYVLFDDRLAPATGLPQLAKSIAHRIAGYAPKLTLDPGQVVRISVLNLRADYASPAAEELERKLTLLLESRLASLPECIVLERRHAWSLGFENMASAPAQPLLQGAYVVDGAVNPPAPGGNQVKVHLRLRAPDHKETPLEAEGSTGDLPGLAERIASAIGQAIGSSTQLPPWQPQAEAREYLLEGIWGYQHHAADSAVEALDSAELLGETAPDLLAARIPMLCAQAVGSPRICFSDEPTPDDFHPAARIEALRRAIDDEIRYEKGPAASQLQILKNDRSLDNHTPEGCRSIIDRTASSLLAMLDRTDATQADELRSAFCAFAGYDPLHGKIPDDWITAIRGADDWSSSIEEETAFYRTLCTTYPWARGTPFQEDFPSLETFCLRFIPDERVRRAAYFKLLENLRDDPVGRPFGLLNMARWATPAEENAACRALYDDLWAEREDLLNSHRLFRFLGQAFALEKKRKVAVADPQLIALLHFELQRESRLDGQADHAWYPELFPPEEAPGLWKDLQDFAARSRDDSFSFPRMRQRYLNRFKDQDPEANAAGSPSLTIRRFWYPKEATGSFDLASYPLQAVPDGVWVAGEESQGNSFKPALYHVLLDGTSFMTEPAIEPSGIFPQAMAIMPEALYVLGTPIDRSSKTVVERFDRVSRQWSKREAPASKRVFAVAGRLYLSLSGDGSSLEGGIPRRTNSTIRRPMWCTTFSRVRAASLAPPSVGGRPIISVKSRGHGRA